MDIAFSAILLLGFPLTVLILLRANFGVVFLAACAGLVLVENMDGAVVTTTGSLIPGEGEAYVQLMVVVLSILFAGFVFRDTVVGRRMALHGGIMLLLSAMLWLILPSATGMSWLVNTADSDAWRFIDNFKTLIIAAGLGFSMMAVLPGQSRPGRKKRRR